MTAERIPNAQAVAGRRGNPVLALGGLAASLGSLGVTITSVLYALSPPAAATPMQPLDPAAAVAGALAGAATMRAAGLVGMFSDIILATGALQIAMEAARRRRAWSAAGWMAIFVAVVIFLFVDALVGQLLVPLAATPDGAGAFIGFKRLFDVLFLLGTVAFGIGAIASMTAEFLDPQRQVGRRLAMAGAAIGAVSVTAAAACFAQLPLHLAVGGSILLGGALFTAIGAQIAASGNRADPARETSEAAIAPSVPPSPQPATP